VHKTLIDHPSLGPIWVDAPERWDANVVAERLIEAFKTLARVPVQRGPAPPGNAMPEYLYEWSDLLAQAETDQLEGHEEIDRQQFWNIAAAVRDTWDERNFRRILPTAFEIQRMKDALGWPMVYLSDADPLLPRLVNQWAAHAALPDDDPRTFSDWCEKQGLPAEECRRAARAGMGLIALFLNADSAPI